MRRASLVVVLFAVALLAAAACRPVPSPLYGITFDNDADASTATLNAQETALAQLPHMPTVRVVLDGGTAPADYQAAFTKFNPVAYTLAELLDSSELTSMNATQYEARATTFVEGLTGVDLWEIGNEVNGNWTGSYTSVADKVTRAHSVVRAHGGVSVLTLWENTFGSNHCGNGSGEETPQQWSSRLSATVRSQIGYVLVSWYPTQCSGKPNGNSNLIPAATIKAEMQALHALYPNAKVGFGELGLPNKVTAQTLPMAQQIASYYYGLGDLGLSYYVGFYGWWYGAQDAVPTSKPMWQTLADAME